VDKHVVGGGNAGPAGVVSDMKNCAANNCFYFLIIFCLEGNRRCRFGGAYREGIAISGWLKLGVAVMAEIAVNGHRIARRACPRRFLINWLRNPPAFTKNG